MPTDETRRLLRTFGVAVTTLEDAVLNQAPADEAEKAARHAGELLAEVTALVERLRGEASRPKA